MQKSFLNIFNSILGSIREPLLVIDSNLRVVDANPSFYKIFCVNPQETVGTLIYDLGNGQWNIPKLKELLEQALPENTVYNDFEVEHEFETIGPKIMHLNARRIYREPNHAPLILLAIEDVTEREYYKRHLEKIVETRTAELVIAKQEAEKKKTGCRNRPFRNKKAAKTVETGKSLSERRN